MVKFVERPVGLKRALVLVAINVLGVAAIIASGGGEPTGGGPGQPPPPAINNAPENVSVQAGGTAVFSVTATTTNGPLRYQWQRATASSSFVDIQGATDSSFSLNGVQLGDDGAVPSRRFRYAGPRFDRCGAACSLAVAGPHFPGRRVPA
jgi:hypothetical protein